MTLISGILVGGIEVYAPDGRGTTPNEVAAERFEN